MSNEVVYQVVSMTADAAYEMYKTEWWVNMDLEEAAQKQLFTDEDIMPADLYLEGLRKLLKRNVSLGELLYTEERLRAEYLGLAVRPEYDVIKAANDAVVKETRVVEVPDERE